MDSVAATEQLGLGARWGRDGARAFGAVALLAVCNPGITWTITLRGT